VAFRVSESQLGAAKGMVRCGLCFKAFNGQANLEELSAGDVPSANKDQADQQAKAASTNTKSWKDDDDFYIDDNFDLAQLEEALKEKSDSRKFTAIEEKSVNTAPEHDGQAAETKEHKTAPTSKSGGIHQQPAPAIATPAQQPVASLGSRNQPLNGQPDQDREEVLSLDAEAMARWQPAIGALIGDDTEQQEAGSDSGTATSTKPLQWPWYAASALALLLLGGQLLYFNSSQIDPTSNLWPMTKWLCDSLDCPLKANRDVSKIASTDLVVRTHPSAVNALLVDAVITNNASFNQPFPNLTLVFENLQGSVVAQRTFVPQEYLHGELRGVTSMPSRQPIKLELEIIDPGKEAVSFRLYAAE
jgi:predicted Zn finger-like uncharacterized protein